MSKLQSIEFWLSVLENQRCSVRARSRAAQWIGDQGRSVAPVAFPAILRAVGEPIEELRGIARYAIGGFCPLSDNAIPLVAGALLAGDNDTTVSILRAMRVRWAGDGPVLMVLVPLILHGDVRVCSEAVHHFMTAHDHAIAAVLNLDKSLPDSMFKHLNTLCDLTAAVRTIQAGCEGSALRPDIGRNAGIDRTGLTRLYLTGLSKSRSYQQHAILKLVAGDDAGVRAISALALARFANAQSLGPLCSLLSDNDAQVRRCALLSLLELAPNIDIPQEPLVPLLYDSREGVCRLACRMLERINRPCQRSMPAFQQLLLDPDTRTRCDAAKALGVAAGGSDEAVSLLLTCLTDPREDELVADAAEAALRRVLRDSQSRLKYAGILADLLGHENWQVRKRIVRVVRELIPGRRPELPEPLQAREWVNDEIRDVFLNWGTAFCGGPLPKAIIVGLLPLLRDPYVSIREETITTLDIARATDERVLSALCDRLADREPCIRNIVIQFFKRLHVRTQPAIRGLLGLLTDGDDEVRLDAALALAVLAPEGSEPIPVLLHALDQSPLEHERRRAAEALGNLSISDDNVLVALQKALLDIDPDVREAAKTALDSKQREPESGCGADEKA